MFKKKCVFLFAISIICMDGKQLKGLGQFNGENYVMRFSQEMVINVLIVAGN